MTMSVQNQNRIKQAFVDVLGYGHMMAKHDPRESAASATETLDSAADGAGALLRSVGQRLIELADEIDANEAMRN